MRSNHLRRGWAWLIAVSLMLHACTAWAQEAPSDASDAGDSEVADDDPFADEEDDVQEIEESETEADEEAIDPNAGLETITVTAQKRSQSLQEVPAAVSALSGGQLDDAGFTAMQDIQSLVPNLHFGQENGTAKVTIRGVSSAQGTDQSTAIHIDGVYQNRARAITALTFFDLQRIEVLRGPQGTLYGRNATGGAMNIISNPPSQDFELFGDVQLGNYWQQMLRGVVNVPIAEDLAAVRVSGYYENRDGYQKNFCQGRPDDNSDPSTPNCNRPTGPGNDADDANDYGIRAQARLTPGDAVETTLRFNYLRKKGVGYALKRDGALPDGINLPVIGLQDIYAGATPNPENQRHVFMDTQGSIDIETINGNADMTWAAPEMPFFGETKLKVIGSFTQFNDDEKSDQDYADLFIASLDQSEEAREWVAEINWQSDNDDEFGWLLGLFHMGTNGLRTVDAPSNLRIALAPPPADPLDFEVPFFQTFDTSAYSVAVFMNAWYEFTEKLKGEVGFRYSHDWKESNLTSNEVGILNGLITIFSPVDDPRKDNWGRPSGSVSLSYQLTDETLVYTRFATGYKSGALNNDIAPLGGGIISPPNADPEDIFALEGAVKNTLLDNRLLLNGTVFTYWYRDLQVSQLFEAQNIIQNAATARVWGLEGEMTYRPIDALTLTAQFAYLNTYYSDFEGCIDAKDLLPDDCTGNRLSRAPRFSGTFIAMYAFDFDRFGTLTPFGQVYASDKVFFRPTNEPEDTQDAYFLLNFRLMWQSEGGRLGVDLFVDNALDTDVATTKIVGSSLLGAPLLNAYDRPRTVGARLSLGW